MKPLWLPNALTVFRCFAAVGVALLMMFAIPETPLVYDRGFALWAFVVFVLAAFTDWLDGWLARLWRASTGLGSLLDPIADKLLVGLPFLVIAEVAVWSGHVEALGLVVLPILMIVMRDVAVTLLRFTSKDKSVIAVAALSKWKTALEMLVLGSALAVFALGILPGAMAFYTWSIALWAAAILSIYTGYRYFRGAFSDA